MTSGLRTSNGSSSGVRSFRFRASRIAREVERLARRLRTLDAEPARPYRRLRDGDYRGTRALHEDLLPGRTDLGIHRLPAGSGQLT